jgi:hypothetical protein
MLSRHLWARNEETLMPQASDELSARWTSDSALELIQRDNYFQIQAGIIRPVKPHVPTAKELDAIDYLFHEWDFGYDPAPV